MTGYKLIAKLLQFEDFRCNGLISRRGNRLEVLAKPYRNGCRHPECGRRGAIVRQRPEVRFWLEVLVGHWLIWVVR